MKTLTDIKQQREAEFDKEFPQTSSTRPCIKFFLHESLSLIEKEVRKEEREKIKEELLNAIENKKSTRLSRDHQPYQVCLLEMSALVNELLNEKPE